MNNKMNGVKFSVKKPVKNISKKIITEKKIKKSETAQKIPPAKIKMPKKTNNRVISIVVSIAVTALIAGGGVYMWQKKASLNIIEQKEKEAQNLKYDLEEILNKTKSKLTGAESDNDNLKKINEELKAKAEILNIAKREFYSEEYGFSFFYPAAFGEAVLEIEEGVLGKKIIGKFSNNEKLTFGAITEDYKAATSSKLTFLDTQGFRKRWNSYYFKALGSDTYEINLVKVIEIGGQEAVLVDKNSFTIEGEEIIPVDMGGDVGFIINLENEEFTGIGFLNSDFGVLPLEDFELLIKTIKTN